MQSVERMKCAEKSDWISQMTRFKLTERNQCGTFCYCFSMIYKMSNNLNAMNFNAWFDRCDVSKWTIKFTHLNMTKIRILIQKYLKKKKKNSMLFNVLSLFDTFLFVVFISISFEQTNKSTFTNQKTLTGWIIT